ncbi:MAG: RNA polymerase sigma-70 factor [Bacteroides sp.]|nr:RNA polymerase sigma-70 factor [Bacteroides sp.]
MHVDNNDERYIIERLRSGHKEAFQTIYDIYGRRMLAYCIRLTGNAEDAEDLVQDVFLNLWRTKDELKNVDTLRPYLFTSLRNRILNLWKSRLNSNLYNDYIKALQEPDSHRDFENIEYREFERMIAVEMDKLPPTQRRVVRMSRLENLEVVEIAAELGLSVQTIKNALSSGLKTLRQSLGKNSGLLILLFTIASLIFHFKDMSSR